LTSPEHLKSQFEGCPRIGDAHPVVLVIPGYAPLKQISNLSTLASTQHGNTHRIENNGSTSYRNRYAPACGMLIIMMMWYY